jgi:predicted secreted protein
MSGKNGTSIMIRISLDGGITFNNLAFSQEASWSLSTGVRDVTHKKSQGAREVIPGLKSWEVSGSGFVAFNPTDSGVHPGDLSDLINGRQSLWMEILDVSDPATVIVGQTKQISLDQEAPVEDVMSYSCTFSGSGFCADEWASYLADRALKSGALSVNSCEAQNIEELRDILTNN